MKKFIYILLFLAFGSAAMAQPYGNEWINYSQKYFKFKISRDGIYRIDSTTLANSGIPLNIIDPRNLQVFGRGMELPIYVKGEDDGVFNSGDFIEFYGQRNDGFLDSLVYTGISFTPNPYVSLYNDTAVYFLSWNTSIDNVRMGIETDTSFGGYTPADYFNNETVSYFRAEYFDGETDGNESTSPFFTKAEGFFDSAISLGDTRSYPLNTPNVYANGPASTMVTLVAGASHARDIFSNDHHLKIDYQTGSGSWSNLQDLFFTGYDAMKFYNSIPSNQLGNTTTVNYTSVLEPGFNSNRTVVSYILLKYPHTYDLEGASSFQLNIPPSASQSKSLLAISNFNDLGSGVTLYDLTKSRRIPVIKNGSTFNALVPNSGGENKCFFTCDNNISYITSALVPVNETGSFTDFSANSPDSAYLIISNKKLKTGVDEYAAYRQSIAGGSHNVIVAYTDELYDQFAFGIEKNALALRRFADYTLDKFPTAPQNLFLIGKGIQAGKARYYASYPVTNYSLNLVPSCGNPASDILITAGLTDPTIEPAIPTGRLSVLNPGQILLYLDKIREYESATPGEWMKNILHFGGGSDVYQQTLLSGYLKGFENTIEAPYFGGNVTTFLKTSGAPIQINTSDTLKQLIENGVTLMTFFGHASGTGFDQSIDEPQNYNNKGKYPFLLANSCLSGNIYERESMSSSEVFVLIKDKGMIGYLGGASLGIAQYLQVYSSNFYNNISRTNYGKSVGSSIKNTIAACASVPYISETALEMTLHGDPAIILNSPQLPDYSIANNDVYFSFDPTNITVNAIIKNIGKALEDTFEVEVTRIFPDNDTIVYLKRIAAPYYKDTLSFQIPIEFAKGPGMNYIRVRLDIYSAIPEMNEFNNSTNPDVPLFVPGGQIIPVYPYEYAVVPNDTVVLKASTNDVFAADRQYKFQLDTTDAFSSPLLTEGIVTGKGGVISWTPPVQLQDSTVYFWRTALIDTGTPLWKESSFQYITGRRGWSQAHFGQYKKDDYQYVNYNQISRTFDFTNDKKVITVQDGMSNENIPWAVPWNQIFVRVNGTVKHAWSCTGWSGGISFFVFDPVSGDNIKSHSSIAPDPGVDSTYGNYVCDGSQASEAFDFLVTDSTERAKITQFINMLPAGSKVLAYTQQHFNPSLFEESLYQAFQSIGATRLRGMADDVSYILWGTKGRPVTKDDPHASMEVVADSTYQTISLTDTFSTNWNKGYIASRLIGPAKAWTSLHWKQHSLENNSLDSIRLSIIGIDANGTETVLLSNITPAQADILNLSDYADASYFPYLKLITYMQDDSLRTPPQMDRWQVLYSPVPEGAINPSSGFIVNASTLQEGDVLKLSLAFQNISEIDFTDSLLISYKVEDANRNITVLPSSLKWPPLTAGQTLIDTVNINTANFAGLNTLWIEFNPAELSNSQLEQYHFNNLARINFTTTKDKTNPLLDVTFDGQHILNGDIVSAKPNILIKLKDENRFLALNDTSDFAVFLKDPASNLQKRIYFNQGMVFTPAVLPNNSCQINYTPELLADGSYQLLVQAQDRSSNESGAVDYKIDFEVINKATITEVLNYPNPFSTSTRFVFTLTGSEVPQYFKIQIMTVTGKVVKEIDQNELGPVHVGRNITEYSWNGKDDYGDQLANGIYLYRVLSQLNGSSLEKRDSGADQFITKGFGKMYLIR